LERCGHSEPLPLLGDGLPERSERSRDPRCRLRSGDRLPPPREAASFVYDVADLYKVETVVPAAFAVAAKIAREVQVDGSPEPQVRIACREMFRESGLLERIIPDIETLLRAGRLAPPTDGDDAPEAPEPAIPRKKASGDDGHRG
jgi:hypothetical protein